MSLLQLKLNSHCREMNICGVDIIGNPDTHTIIGLDDEGMALIKRIKDHEIIDDSLLTENEKLLIREMTSSGYFLQNIKERSIISTYLHVTSHCNLSCPGCYSFEENRNNLRNLTLDEIKTILNNLTRAGLEDLVISGGEPFCRDDIEEILRYAKVECGIKQVECITNGTADINRYRAASKHVDKLSFSLDSADPESAMIRSENVFNKVKEKILILRNEGANIEIIFTIHHGNIAQCKRMVEFADELKVSRRLSIFTVEKNEKISDLMLDPDDYKKFKNLVISGEHTISVEDSSLGGCLGCIDSCGAGKNTIAIASDGSIYPCHMFVGKKQLIIGNAIKDDIKTVVNNTQNNMLYNLTVDDVEQCKGCKIRYVCGGGCRFRAYATEGNIYGSDPMCEIYHESKLAAFNSIVNACK